MIPWFHASLTPSFLKKDYLCFLEFMIHSFIPWFLQSLIPSIPWFLHLQIKTSNMEPLMQPMLRMEPMSPDGPMCYSSSVDSVNSWIPSPSRQILFSVHLHLKERGVRETTARSQGGGGGLKDPPPFHNKSISYTHTLWLLYRRDMYVYSKWLVPELFLLYGHAARTCGVWCEMSCQTLRILSNAQNKKPPYTSIQRDFGRLHLLGTNHQDALMVRIFSICFPLYLRSSCIYTDSA